MTISRRSRMFASALLAVVGFGNVLAAADKEEILARGPVHEAFADPTDQQPAPTPIVPKDPPAAIEELPPDQKPAGDNVQWIPGYWHWDEERKDFIWISGFWRVPPPNRTWVPGTWRQTQQGQQWTPGFWITMNQQQAEVEYLPSPPAPVEVGPTTPSPMATAVYVPGVWVYRLGRFVWRPGYWIENRVGWIWISAHYRWTPYGYVYIDGYWDHPLVERGLLFAPVYIPRDVYMARDYCWHPSIVVRTECLYGSLFVRRGWSCYYFGDYFDASYSDWGFVSWCGYRGGRSISIVRGWHDPLFSYYSVTYRDQAYWRSGVSEVYAARFRGEIGLPARTLALQDAAIGRLEANNGLGNRNAMIQNVSMLTPLGQAERVSGIRLQNVPQDVRQQQGRAAQELNALGLQRGRLEAQLGNGGPKVDGPRSLKLDLPKSAVLNNSTNGGAPRIGTLPSGGTSQNPPNVGGSGPTISGGKTPSGIGNLGSPSGGSGPGISGGPKLGPPNIGSGGGNPSGGNSGIPTSPRINNPPQGGTSGQPNIGGNPGGSGLPKIGNPSSSGGNPGGSGLPKIGSTPSGGGSGLPNIGGNPGSSGLPKIGNPPSGGGGNPGGSGLPKIGNPPSGGGGSNPFSLPSGGNGLPKIGNTPSGGGGGAPSQPRGVPSLPSGGGLPKIGSAPSGGGSGPVTFGSPSGGLPKIGSTPSGGGLPKGGPSLGPPSGGPSISGTPGGAPKPPTGKLPKLP